MQIEVIDVNVENKGKYRAASVAYKTSEGKVEGKKIMSFASADVFKLLSEAKQGDVFEIQSEKNAKGYWEWTQASPAGKNTAGVEASKPAFQKAASAGRDFETAEERAKKQVYIVRQSSVTAALGLAELNKTKAPITEADVISSARKFEQYVFDTGAVVEEAEVQ